jgi:hypothetical protein
VRLNSESLRAIKDLLFCCRALGTRDTVISQPGGLATQQENVSMDNVSIGERRPILSLDPNLIELSVDFALEHCPMSG